MDRTNAERQRRYIARLKAKAAQGSVSNAPEIAALKAKQAEAHAKWKAHVAEIEAELDRERRNNRHNFKAAEEFKRDIRRLKRENKKMQEEILTLTMTAAARPKTDGSMSFKTKSLIAKCLHPDSRNDATEADKDEACKLFTAWKSDKDKARRRTR
jgi:hypothetical protein